ncbi:Swi5-domain-containing protein [Tilletiaria anomala UBC 951]|uniref:Swi5-domain-containing protein n=1 Tax=Tilletiaria anomala (strain ATCC 24038 / CBS 436.72 / UBC 951) TaxID=1037660 RepID=A0A066VA87_TILAU|nr:Swi5-domain-containing protein [Tilletiaria anomala UBC 951]KDN37208.1 Swi5-domain-containing protein [Tilletiaria anomala UBC 951]
MVNVNVSRAPVHSDTARCACVLQTESSHSPLSTAPFSIQPKVKIPAFKPLSIRRFVSPTKGEGVSSSDNDPASSQGEDGKAPLAASLASGSLVALRRMSEQEKEVAVEALQAQAEQLEEQLGGRDAEQIVKEHIRLLHEYNEVKDATQILLGRLAHIEGVTIKAMHQRYDLPMDG